MRDTVRRCVARKTQFRRSKVLNSNIGHNYIFIQSAIGGMCHPKETALVFLKINFPLLLL